MKKAQGTADAWALRAQDWNAPIFAYEEVAAALQKEDNTSVFKAVILCNGDQKEVVSSLLRGSGKQHSVLLVIPGTAPDAQRCPGIAHNVVSFRMVSFVRVVSSKELAAPGPKVVAPKVPKVEAVQTAVIYVKLHERYTSGENWKQAVKSPQSCFHKWMLKHKFQLRDSWGWIEECGHGERAKRIFGFARVLASDVEAILQFSGDDFFFDPARDVQLPPMQTEWTQPNEDEDDAAFLARCRKESPAFGLVVGKRNIGLRQKRDKDTPVSRVWLLQGVPKYWTHDQVQDSVGKTLTNVSLLKQRVVRGSIDYFLRGSTTSSDDMIAVPVEDSTGNLVLWLRWAPRGKIQHISDNVLGGMSCIWRLQSKCSERSPHLLHLAKRQMTLLLARSFPLQNEWPMSRGLFPRV